MINFARLILEQSSAIEILYVNWSSCRSRHYTSWNYNKNPVKRYGVSQRCSAKKRGVGTAFPQQMTRNTAPNSSNKVSIRLQEFPLFVTSLMSQSVITQPCYSAILAITCHLFIYAAPGASSNVNSAERCGNAFSSHYTPGVSTSLTDHTLFFLA